MGKKNRLFNAYYHEAGVVGYEATFLAHGVHVARVEVVGLDEGDSGQGEKDGKEFQFCFWLRVGMYEGIQGLLIQFFHA